MGKRIISSGVFSFFQKMDFPGRYGDKKAKHNKKNSVCRTPYFRRHTSYDHDFWYTCGK